MPDDTNPAQPNDASLWDAIEAWIPEEKLRDYYRFVRDVKDLPGTDAVLQAILAMGILTVVTRQVPGEVVKTLSAVETRVNSLLAAAQENADRVMRAMENRSAALERLQYLIVSPQHMEAVADNAMKILEERLDRYLQPISRDKAAAFAVRANRAEQSLSLMEKKCKDGIVLCNDLFGRFRNGIVTIENVGKELRASTTQKVIDELERDFRWRTWKWMAMCILLCIVLVITTWVLCWSSQRPSNLEKLPTSGVAPR